MWGSLEAKKGEKRKKITNVPNQMFTLRPNGDLPITPPSLMKLWSASLVLQAGGHAGSVLVPGTFPQWAQGWSQEGEVTRSWPPRLIHDFLGFYHHASLSFYTGPANWKSAPRSHWNRSGIFYTIRSNIFIMFLKTNLCFLSKSSLWRWIRKHSPCRYSLHSNTYCWEGGKSDNISN